MNKLESLLLEQQYLLQYVAENKAKINEQQIVREAFLTERLGFIKIEELNTIVIYKRKTTNNGIYVLTLDLKRPNLIYLQKEDQDKIYGFFINTIEEFIDLLAFLNIY